MTTRNSIQVCRKAVAVPVMLCGAALLLPTLASSALAFGVLMLGRNVWRTQTDRHAPV